MKPALDAKTRVLVAPYSGVIGDGGNYASDDDHEARVRKPLDQWATDHGLELIFVEGVQVTVYGKRGSGVGPSTIPELRQTTAYLDVSSSVIFAARYAAGIDKDKVGDFDYPNATPEAPTPKQVDDLAGKLRDSAVYHAAGRDDPVDARMAQLAKQDYGLTVRIAALPALEPGEPFVDYAPELLKRFPGEVVMVAQGRWLDVAASAQAKADSARDYAYGRYEYASFTQGSPMQDRIGTVLKRLRFLLKDSAYGRPQPQPQPKATPFDVRQTISGLTPWVLVGAALVLGGVGLYTWRRGQAARADAERRAMRRARAYPGGVPRRAPVIPPPPAPDTLQTWQIVLSLVGILVGTIALFVVLRLVGQGVARRSVRDADARNRNEATSARLNKLADVVLHPATPRDAAEARRQADLAGQYVLVLGDFEKATTRAKLADVNERITELQEAAT